MTEHVSPTDNLFPHRRCPTVISAAPGRAWLHNCNHIQLNIQFSCLLIRPVIRKAEPFLQKPAQEAVSEDPFWRGTFSLCLFEVQQNLTNNYLEAQIISPILYSSKPDFSLPATLFVFILLKCQKVGQ